MSSPLCRWLVVIALVLLSAHCFGDDPCQEEVPPPTADAAPVASFTSPKASTGIVTGKVLGSGTTIAVPGALVKIRTKSATTAANGTFKITGLASGGTTIKITKTGYKAYSKWIVLIAGTLPMGNIKLVPVGKVTGNVVTAGTSTGLSGVRVSCGGVAVTTGSTGVYTLSNVPAGKQTLQATKTGYVTYKATVTITAGGTLTRNIGLSVASTVGEGTGIIAVEDIDPLGSNGGPIDLRYLTLPESGSYQLILTAGPEQPPLPNPWIMLLAGHVESTSQSFLAAYNGGTGVLAQNHGTNLAQVTVTANAGDEFTFAFSSWTGGLGNYTWRLVRL